MKRTITTLMALLLSVTINYGQTGAFGSDCPTLAQQQAAYNASLNQSKANAIVVRDTASQQLQCHYSQLATYWNQVYKTEQQANKDIQQKNKDVQQAQTNQQQLDTNARQLAADTAQKAKALELAAREALIKNNEEECNDMYVFYCELKVIVEKPDHTDKEVSDHVKLKINHSGQADLTNPGNTTNNNGGILNPSN